MIVIIQDGFGDSTIFYGTMGGCRSVAVVQGVLYLTPEPMNAGDICETLSIARFGVSQALKEPEGWELVSRVMYEKC